MTEGIFGRVAKIDLILANLATRKKHHRAVRKMILGWCQQKALLLGVTPPQPVRQRVLPTDSERKARRDGVRAMGRRQFLKHLKLVKREAGQGY